MCTIVCKYKIDITIIIYQEDIENVHHSQLISLRLDKVWLITMLAFYRTVIFALNIFLLYHKLLCFVSKHVLKLPVCKKVILLNELELFNTNGYYHYNHQHVIIDIVIIITIIIIIINDIMNIAITIIRDIITISPSTSSLS